MRAITWAWHTTKSKRLGSALNLTDCQVQASWVWQACQTHFTLVLTSVPYPRYLMLDVFPSLSVLGLTCIPNPHYLELGALSSLRDLDLTK